MEMAASPNINMIRLYLDILQYLKIIYPDCYFVRIKGIYGTFFDGLSKILLEAQTGWDKIEI
jgi:hypothetical protein